MVTLRARRLTFAISALLIAGACQSRQPDALAALVAGPTAVARAARLSHAMQDSSGLVEDDAPVARWLLPPALREISGLTLTADGRLLAHTDEIGQVWEIDYRRGVLIKHFSIGSGAVDRDFEGITIVRDTIWLLTSKGVLYAFPEGKDGERVAYTKYDTGLGKVCEFEGVAFDPALDALLLACKNAVDKTRRGQVVIYRWHLPPDTAKALAPIAISLASVRGSNTWTKLQVSDISIEPRTGNYLLIASKQQALVSISPNGAPVFARALPSGHPQPEGLAITNDGLMLISDEAANGTAMITLYRWP
jgi:uncharacterized protein YjiK